MIKVVNITLENEMDLVLAHKRSMKIAELLGLTTSTQTTFATAVSEIARTVIEQTDNGTLDIGLQLNQQRYCLMAIITFDSEIHFTNSDAGFFYAQKLVPEFNLIESSENNQIEMKIGLPRLLKIDQAKINAIKKTIEKELPPNAYDEIKQRNVTLNKLANEQEEELRRSKIFDEKKTEFISTASHEFKTPITILKAYTQLAKSLQSECSENVKGILTKIDVQTSKLQSLVQQLLDISKMENGSIQYTFECINFNDFITEIKEIMSHVVPHHELNIITEDDIRVKIDKLRMEQVFSNLIGNAAKYSKKNTSINICCKVEDNSLLKVSVTDEGIGMSAISINSIFDKFYRDKDVMKSHTGLGMGLYITSKIISDHEGEIWVESQEEIGSTFYFTIPCAPLS
jgi:signal transduction histidine kinase